MAIAFTGTGNTRTFTAPSVPGYYTIRVVLRDSSNPPRTGSKTQTVRVGPLTVSGVVRRVLTAVLRRKPPALIGDS